MNVIAKKSCKTITEGREYQVIRDVQAHFQIEDDNGNLRWFTNTWFHQVTGAANDE